MQLPRSIMSAAQRKLRATIATLGLAAGGCFGADYSIVERFGPPGDEIPPASPVHKVSPTVVRSQSPLTPVASLPAGSESQVQMAALVGQSPVYEFEVRLAVMQRGGELAKASPQNQAALLQKIRREELRNLVERELLLTDMAVKLHLDERPELKLKLEEAADKEADRRFQSFMKANHVDDPDKFAEVLRSQGLSEKIMRYQIKRAYMMAEYVRQVIAVQANKSFTIGELYDYYNGHPDEFATEDRIEWQDLFVAYDTFQNRDQAKQFAEALMAKASAGEDFVELVKRYDQGDSKLRDGAGLGTEPGKIRPTQVEPTLLSLREGQVSPPIETPGGYHIVRVVKRVYAGQLPFDREVQDRVREKLMERAGEREFRRTIDELRRNVPVIIFDN